MKKPTDKQVQTEIELLRAMKPKVRRTSSFGDNHHDAIEAQIEVLEKDMSEDSIFDRLEEEGEDDDAKWRQNVVDSALEARRWLDGDEKDVPSKGWKELM